MKTKTVMQTVGPLGKDHNYLGHFKSEKVLNEGHNYGPYLRNPEIADRIRKDESRPRKPNVVKG